MSETKSGKVRFPFENAIRDNLPMPDGMPLRDQHAFFLLERIYSKFRADLLTSKQAGEQKRKLWAQWDKERREAEFLNKAYRQFVIITKETERLKAEIKKNPSAELAVQLVDVLDGRVFKGGEDG